MKEKKIFLPGLHIQWPWSRLLLRGSKSIETRSYPLPKKYVEQPLALIETPGPEGKKKAGIRKAQIIGVLVFSGSKKYQNHKEWKKDFSKHKVPENDSQFAYHPKKEKWGWIVKKCESLPEPLPAPKKRGIVFAKKCEISSKDFKI